MSLKSFFGTIFSEPPCNGPYIVHKDDPRAHPTPENYDSGTAPWPWGMFKPVIHAAPTREEFATWRDNPITEFVMAALARNAEECREQWMQISWDGGDADQRRLDAFRERSDALLGFTADYDAFCETLGLEPQPLEVDDAA